VPVAGFGKECRILDSNSYRRIQRGGKKRVVSHCLLFVHQGQGIDGCRIGITASRKVGGAVVRNRVKRVIREFFRARRSSFSGNWDFVVVVRNAAGRDDNRKLHQALEQVFEPYLNSC